MKTEIYETPDECRNLWEKIWPGNGLFDLWQVRSCFHEAFSRPLRFHMVEEDNRIVGFLPLCWAGEADKYIQFPGETWHGKTWLEQNRIIASTPEVLETLLDSVPGALHLRYLVHNPLPQLQERMNQDELGYLFFPGSYDFSFDNYWHSFSGKFRKKLKADLKKLNTGKVSIRFNRLEDLEYMFRMNLESFGENSYFSDSRFYIAFNNLAAFLEKNGMLRVTTVLIDSAIAAVDMGGLWKNTYTLLAGGTNPEFPGVAKLINLHHLNWSCQKKIQSVDFLCGDFNWKERFHLTPVPLYALSLEKNRATSCRAFHEKELTCA
ncbi:MAG: GNAT family N-acetyltransferase [Desulfobacterium sp.]|nr:GNAT family N-acetyltransferase [Desulfobacterium sp.]